MWVTQKDQKQLEIVLELKLKSYFLWQDMLSHDYLKKINACLNADSDFDLNDDYVQYDLSALLIDHWDHAIENNNVYFDSDFNTLWFLHQCFICENTTYWKKKNKTCCHYFHKDLK